MEKALLKRPYDLGCKFSRKKNVVTKCNRIFAENKYNCTSFCQGKSLLMRILD